MENIARVGVNQAKRAFHVTAVDDAGRLEPRAVPSFVLVLVETAPREAINVAEGGNMGGGISE